MSKKILIGSHMGLTSPNYLLDVVKESIENGANTYMIYTGAPQNTIRKDVNLFKIDEAHKLMDIEGIDKNDVIVHAPYIINLCSSKKEVRELACEFLEKELIRVDALGFNKLVLHPGSRLDQDIDVAIEQISSGINKVFDKVKNNVSILLETMAGKGSEVGWNIDEIKNIINKINDNSRIAVCLDTCHLNDSGVDLSNFDNYLDLFDSIIGINKIKCVHINDSKNPLGSRKDRHENIGYGTIGFEKILKVIYNERLMNVPKILETPWPKKNGKEYSPYKIEIEMIKLKKFNNWL